MADTDAGIRQLADRVRDAAARGARLRIRGGGSKDWYGQRPEGEILDTRAYAGIVDYEPTELVITARCGTPLAEIEAVLAERKQMLAFEPPHFAHFGDGGATLGGTIAAGLSGPRRASSGALRDFVLGAKLLDGKGDILTFGGQVMKNVAGYDVSRLLAGSLGTLGLIAPGFDPGPGLTTPDPVSLAESLAGLARAGVTRVAMEASSHGLDQFRLDGASLAEIGRAHV